MQRPASENDILDFNSPADFFGGTQPLLSSANSKWDGVLIEIYQIPKFGPSPRHCYSGRHLVSLQRTGVIESHEDDFPRYWYPGSVAICPIRAPQTSYTFLDARFTVAMLDPSFVREAIGDAINMDSVEILSRGRPFRDEQLVHLLRTAELEIESGLPGGRLFLESFGTALALQLLTHHATKRVTPRPCGNTMPQYLLRRTINFIRENLGKNMSLAELSAGVRMSKYHFCHLFKRSTGFSPHQYVKRERVQRARQLLDEHRLSLVEIANELGFSDQSHFTRTFHTVVGVTPSQYAAKTCGSKWPQEFGFSR
ncbi:MAG: AraC family transcriptional regulator [Candidatus Binataceae bacterium]|jgi:AraC family transcriptional regulator|nr:AraC family transcriptional regulator [Candidatus Binataceae bacterium]